MAYVSKTWVDRDSQYPTRRVLVHSDLSEEQVTVRRDEGIITTQGDVFDANTMNNLEARIAAGIGEKQNTLTAGSGISIENDVISATGGGGGGSEIDDSTTALDSTWSSSKISTELGKKQNTLNAGSNITLTPQQDGTVTISATGGGGGGGTYTAGDRISIDSQNAISAHAQHNVIWNGDCLPDLKNKHLFNGLPYGFERTNTFSGFDIGRGFLIDGSYEQDDGKYIVYQPPVPLVDEENREGISTFILELYWTDDANASPVVYNKEELELTVNAGAEELTLNGIELNVALGSGTYGGVVISVYDSSNALGDIWITGLNLTVKDSMLWTPHDIAVQEYVTAAIAASYTEVTGTLAAGTNTVTLTSSAIKTTATYDIYTDVYGVNPKAVTVSNGTMTMTFDAQETAVNVKVRLS